MQLATSIPVKNGFSRFCQSVYFVANLFRIITNQLYNRPNVGIKMHIVIENKALFNYLKFTKYFSIPVFRLSNIKYSIIED